MSKRRKLEDVKTSGNEDRPFQFTEPPQVSLLNEKEGRVPTSAPCQSFNNLTTDLPIMPSLTLTDLADSHDNYANDRNHLLNVFPAEVWSLVFEKLENSNQMENVSDSSLFFKELLLPRRQEFLFQSVWGIIESNYENKNARDRLSSLLRLRLVCRTWRNAIDNFYESHPYHFDMLQNAIRPSDVESVTLCIWPTTIANCGRLLSHFHQTHGTADNNPLIGRNIDIRIPHGYDTQQLWTTLQNILDKYGHHVWHCKFNTSKFPYERIRDALSLLPNLKSLEIKSTGLEMSRSRVASNPLPTLEHLQILRCRSIPNPVFKDLLRCSNHVRKLDIVRQPLFSRDEFYSSPVNLRELSITFWNDEEFLGHVQLSLTLRKLYLHCRTAPDIKWKETYQMLEARYKKLESLHVDLTGIGEDNEGYFKRTFSEESNDKLDLPHLTHMELKVKSLISLDVLLPVRSTLTSLKLSLYWALDYQKKNDDCLNIFDCAIRKRPLELNIWDVLPKLKTFTFIHSGFTDSEYKKSFTWSYSRQKWTKEMRAMNKT